MLEDEDFIVEKELEKYWLKGYKEKFDALNNRVIDFEEGRTSFASLKGLDDDVMEFIETVLVDVKLSNEDKSELLNYVFVHKQLVARSKQVNDFILKMVNTLNRYPEISLITKDNQVDAAEIIRDAKNWKSFNKWVKEQNDVIKRQIEAYYFLWKMNKK